MIACAKNLKLLDALGMSTAFARLSGFPLSNASASAKESKFSSINDDIFKRIALRSSMVVFDQEGNAFSAASYAFIISSEEEYAILEYTSPFDGF